MDKIKIAIVGAGSRGTAFAKLTDEHPQVEVVAVAEPRAEYRNHIATTYGLQPEMVFDGWKAFVAEKRDCNAAVVSTMDRDHIGPAVACLDYGYDLFLEKPMAVTLADCQAIADAQERSGAITGVCHSLRYHSACARVKELLDEGAIGDVVTLDQIEQVAWWHQAHSYVRGNWHKEAESTFMLLAKSCHDIDYIAHLIGTECQHVSSFGSLKYFRPENAPEGSAARCLDCGVEADCPYSAIKTYVDGDRDNWPGAVASHDHSREAHLAAITTGPYGQCVWRCENDVVDHQVVSMEFEAGVTATFTMTAFTAGGGRRLRVHGTTGELHFDGETREITIHPFGRDITSSRGGRIPPQKIELPPEKGGHGGGDNRIFSAWIAAVLARDPNGVLTNIHESLRTHRIVFAAETARREHRVVALKDFTG